MISRIIDDVFLTIARFSTVRRLLGCYTLQKINKLIWNTGIAWNTVLCNFSLQTNGFPYLCEVYVHIYLYLYPYRYLYLYMILYLYDFICNYMHTMIQLRDFCQWHLTPGPGRRKIYSLCFLRDQGRRIAKLNTMLPYGHMG